MNRELLQDWLNFSADVQPSCAAGQHQLESLRAKTKTALSAISKLKLSEKELAFCRDLPQGKVFGSDEAENIAEKHKVGRGKMFRILLYSGWFDKVALGKWIARKTARNIH